jgi:taurine dioxygenase
LPGLVARIDRGDNIVLNLNAVSGALGCEVSGVDLCHAVPDDVMAELQQALLEHEVLFFRDQELTPEAHSRFASWFGPPQLHQAYPHVEGFPEITILENDRENPSRIEMWHTDMTFRKNPPLGSVLHGVVIPEGAGDTVFASMSAAYNGLSTAMQTFLSGLTAVHDFAFGFKESLEEPGGRDRLAQMVLDNPPVEHPVVRTHPLSGKPGLYVNSLFTSHIKGMKPKESSTLLNFLYDHLIAPEFTCRFRWQRNSIAFWDNRITQHKPVNDYWPRHRKLQRITIDGDWEV